MLVLGAVAMRQQYMCETWRRSEVSVVLQWGIYAFCLAPILRPPSLNHVPARVNQDSDKYSSTI
jgi:hypothetical protein